MIEKSNTAAEGRRAGGSVLPLRIPSGLPNKEKTHVLIVGRVVPLEVDDEVMGDDGGLDSEKARPLLMTGTRKGMRYCKVTFLGAALLFNAFLYNPNKLIYPLFSDRQAFMRPLGTARNR